MYTNSNLPYKETQSINVNLLRDAPVIFAQVYRITPVIRLRILNLELFGHAVVSYAIDSLILLDGFTALAFYSLSLNREIGFILIGAM